jgi:hypothetical protein
LHLADGSVAVAQYNRDTGWNWGTIGEPAQDVVSYTFLGKSISAIESNANRFSSIVSKLGSTKLTNALIGALDSGGLNSGQPVMYSANGTASSGTAPPGSDVTPVNNVANALGNAAGNISLPSVGGIFGVFASLGFWKGIGLVLAGAAILVFAAIEFKNIAV